MLSQAGEIGFAGPGIDESPADAPPIEGGEVTSAPSGPRQRFSFFLVTVSTNKREDSWVPRLRQATEEMTGTHHGLRFILRFVEGSYSDIVRIQRKYSIERGTHSQGGRVHTHILLQFTHTAKLQLDYGKIRQWYLMKLGLRVHLDVKLINSQNSLVSDVERYISKNPLVVAQA